MVWAGARSQWLLLFAAGYAGVTDSDMAPPWLPVGMSKKSGTDPPEVPGGIGDSVDDANHASRFVDTARSIRTKAAFFAEETVRYAVVAGLVVIAGVVLVRTFLTLFSHPGDYPETVAVALDGVLVVIIVLDIMRTVLSHLESDTFPVRPFLVVGVLAGIREILSASARLALTVHFSAGAFRQGIIQVGVGVGVAVTLSLVLLITPGDDGSSGPRR